MQTDEMPACENTNSYGMLRTFLQDSGCSVIGTALFEELPIELFQKFQLGNDDTGWYR